MPNIELHRAEARQYNLKGFYYANKENWLQASVEYENALVSINMIPEEERSDEDIWLQSRNYCRAAFAYCHAPESVSNYAFDYYTDAIRCLQQVKNMRKDQMGSYAEIYQKMRDLCLGNDKAYRLFDAATRVFTYDESYYINDSGILFATLYLEQRYMAAYLQLLILIRDSHAARLLPNKGFEQYLDDPRHLANFNETIQIIERAIIESREKASIDLTRAVQALGKLKAGVFSVTHETASDDIGLQPNKYLPNTRR